MKIWRKIFLVPSAIAALTFRLIDSLISIFITTTLLQIAEGAFIKEKSMQIGRGCTRSEFRLGTNDVGF